MYLQIRQLHITIEELRSFSADLVLGIKSPAEYGSLLWAIYLMCLPDSQSQVASLAALCLFVCTRCSEKQTLHFSYIIINYNYTPI